MAEYICRNDIISKIRLEGIYGSGYSDQEREDDVVDMIESIPAADVVEVVRCKDCIYASMTSDGTCKYCDVWFQDEAVYLDGDYYCADGERKSDG